MIKYITKILFLTTLLGLGFIGGKIYEDSQPVITIVFHFKDGSPNIIEVLSKYCFFSFQGTFSGKKTCLPPTAPRLVSGGYHDNLAPFDIFPMTYQKGDGIADFGTFHLLKFPTGKQVIVIKQ